MASKNTKAAVVVQEDPVVQNHVNESTYTATELAENHKFFNTSHEIVVVALKMAGKQTATISEAKAIIEKFKNREVN